MDFDYEEDVQGLIRGIAEEVSYRSPENHDSSNWFTAKSMLGDGLGRYITNSSFQKFETLENPRFIKVVHELISAKARRLHEKNPESDSVTNWLTAQKDLAVEVYWAGIAYNERDNQVKELKGYIDRLTHSDLRNLTDYQSL